MVAMVWEAVKAETGGPSISISLYSSPGCAAWLHPREGWLRWSHAESSFHGNALGAVEGSAGLPVHPKVCVPLHADSPDGRARVEIRRGT